MANAGLGLIKLTIIAVPRHMMKDITPKCKKFILPKLYNKLSVPKLPFLARSSNKILSIPKANPVINVAIAPLELILGTKMPNRNIAVIGGEIYA